MAEEKKGVVKKHAVSGTKLLAALGALTTAINGYNGVVEKQEQMLYVMSSKINSLTEKVAYLDGRLAGQSHELAEASAHARMQPSSDLVVPEDELLEDELDDDGDGVVDIEDVEDALPERAEEGGEAYGMEGDDDGGVVGDFSGLARLVVDAPSKAVKRKRRPKKIKDLAYQQLPINLDNLEQFQQQLQIHEDELK